jgi:disulfide oxidoreductase YuzD
MKLKFIHIIIFIALLLLIPLSFYFISQNKKQEVILQNINRTGILDAWRYTIKYAYINEEVGTVNVYDIHMLQAVVVDIISSSDRDMLRLALKSEYGEIMYFNLLLFDKDYDQIGLYSSTFDFKQRNYISKLDSNNRNYEDYFNKGDIISVGYMTNSVLELDLLNESDCLAFHSRTQIDYCRYRDYINSNMKEQVIWNTERVIEFDYLVPILIINGEIKDEPIE